VPAKITTAVAGC